MGIVGGVWDTDFDGEDFSADGLAIISRRDFGVGDHGAIDFQRLQIADAIRVTAALHLEGVFSGFGLAKPAGITRHRHRAVADHHRCHCKN